MPTAIRTLWGALHPSRRERRLAVVIPPALLERVPPSRRAALTAVLANDPRPSYQRDPDRVYGFSFAALEVRFSVRDETLTVLSVEPARPEEH